jgi:hypothetical protein
LDEQYHLKSAIQSQQPKTLTPINNDWQATATTVIIFSLFHENHSGNLRNGVAYSGVSPARSSRKGQQNAEG